MWFKSSVLFHWSWKPLTMLKLTQGQQLLSSFLSFSSQTAELLPFLMAGNICSVHGGVSFTLSISSGQRWEQLSFTANRDNVGAFMTLLYSNVWFWMDVKVLSHLHGMNYGASREAGHVVTHQSIAHLQINSLKRSFFYNPPQCHFWQSYCFLSRCNIFKEKAREVIVTWILPTVVFPILVFTNNAEHCIQMKHTSTFVFTA